MTNRFAGWITGVLALATLLAGLWTLTRIPPGQSVPIHFALDGRANGWAPASVAMFVIPATAALLWIVRILLPRITPRGANLDRSAHAYATIWITIGVVLALNQAVMVASALGYGVNVAVALPAMLGVMFTVIGNVLPKLRWNYVVGIRTPWTLADERVWDKTHRFAGWVMVAGGAILVIGALVPPYTPKPGLVAGVIGLIVLLPIGKSYLLWREGSGGRAAGG